VFQRREISALSFSIDEPVADELYCG